MKTMSKILSIALGLSLALVISCNLLPQEEAPADGTGKVVVTITDAPFPVDLVDEVLITIDRVELRIAGGTCTTTYGEEVGKKEKSNDKRRKEHDYSAYECDRGFVVISGEEKTIDILKLQNGLTEILAEGTIPVGEYDMIRLHVVEATIIIKGNDSFVLKISSGNSSGLKIFLDTPITVTEEGVSEVLVDFDLSRSFKSIGNIKNKHDIKGFMFRPVIRAVNYKKTGILYGKVMEEEGTAVKNALISVFLGDSVVSTALSNSSGEYKLIGLPAKTYALSAEKEGYIPFTEKNIKIAPKAKIRKDIRLARP